MHKISYFCVWKLDFAQGLKSSGLAQSDRVTWKPLIMHTSRISLLAFFVRQKMVPGYAAVPYSQ